MISAYDAVASAFDRHRALPDGVAIAIRAAILSAIGTPTRPRLLDLGAGIGRIGHAFVAAGDSYVALDLSFGMLRNFMSPAKDAHGAPRRVQADGQRLPFADATFDAVLLIQVFGGLRDWRGLLAEARRVLRPAGALVIGHTVAPTDGVDAQMKRRLASFLEEMGVEAGQKNARGDVERWLESNAQGGARVVAATWNAERTPHGFLDRHQTGARFSLLPEPIKVEALRKLREWAVATFDSLDAVFAEPYAFELRVFTFPEGAGR